MHTPYPLSHTTQLQDIKKMARAFLLLPTERSLPGHIVETIVANVHNAEVLGTYDFIDVVDHTRQIGWQIKSTKKSTPVTWKRAKIQDRERLIKESEENIEGCQNLGNAIIRFCNSHVQESIQKYNLKHLVYARLIDNENGSFTYFERELPISGILFIPEDFEWSWSLQKKTTKKEQLPAFHGRSIAKKQSWFAWHGRGENQLHFKGEYNWWPQPDYPCQITFEEPQQKLTISDLLNLFSHLLQE